MDQPRRRRRLRLARAQSFYRELLDRTAALPGVQAATLTDEMPGGFLTGQRRGTEIEGYQAAPEESLEIDAASVGPRYFTNLRTPIVGVARDDQWQSLRQETRPFYWMASQQSRRPRMLLLAHTDGNPAAQIAAVRQTIRGIEPGIPAADIQPLRSFFAAMAYPFQLVAIVLAVCGGLALLLATPGIYGIVSYSVAQRTREVGIRKALGAAGTDILKRVVGDGMAVVAVGLAIGLLMSVALTRVLQSALFEAGLLFGIDGRICSRSPAGRCCSPRSRRWRASSRPNAPRRSIPPWRCVTSSEAPCGSGAAAVPADRCSFPFFFFTSLMCWSKRRTDQIVKAVSRTMRAERTELRHRRMTGAMSGNVTSSGTHRAPPGTGPRWLLFEHQVIRAWQ